MTTGAQSYPAPVGGLNDRDSLASMSPQDAVVLENWWVFPSQVQIRKGSADWTTGYSSPVETIVEYSPQGLGNKLFAASGTQLFDITNQGISTLVVSGKTSARWQEVSISTPGGSFIYLFNGQDDPLLYNGTTWTSINAISSPAITGITTNTLIQGCLWKNRVIAVEKNTLRAWYLPASSIGGAANKIDIGALCVRGGAIAGVFNWTIDGGAGVDDQLVFITTNGEVVVYSGTDPASAATFALVGVYYIGRPIGGPRCAIKYRGDLLISTEEGVLPLSQALLSASIDRRVSVTDKIQNSISLAVQSYGNNFGWELEIFQDLNMLILNVPAGNGMNFQYAQNTITGAWTKFTGWSASTWKNSSFGLMFGDGNSVKQAWVGNSDGITQVVADGLSSFQYFKNLTFGKQFTMVRPYITTSGSPSILYGLNINQTLSDPTGTLSYTPPTGMIWGSMVWGSMFWGGGLLPLSAWHHVGAYATSAGIRLKIQGNGAEVNWSSTDYLYKKAQSVL